MEWQVTLGIEDLTSTRFAISPLYETARALGHVRSGRRPPAALVSWIRWARERVDRDPLRTPLLDELMFGNRPTYPEFLTPAPQSLWTAIDDELDAVVSTARSAIGSSIERVWPDTATVPRVARELADRPESVLAGVADEFRNAYDSLVAPFWPRIRSVLESDVAFKARRIAQGGFDSVFSKLHPEASWDGRTLRVGTTGVRRASVSPGGLILTPTVLGWPDLSIKFSTSSRTAIRYPARGAGALFALPRGEEPEGLVRLIGAGRARVLRQLTTPTTPTDIAAALGVTPSAVTQHLRVLRGGGLVRADRSGRSVVYILTDLGEALLGSRAP